MNAEQTGQTEIRKRSPKRYWREIKGNLYARLQYQDDAGKWREKLRPIDDKRKARSAVEEMRRELTERGVETLQTAKMSFRGFAEIYRRTKLFPAVFENGVKIGGVKPSVTWAVNALVEYFGARRLRSIKPADLETYKHARLRVATARGEKGIGYETLYDRFFPPFGNNGVERDLRILNLQQKMAGCFRHFRGVKTF